ncbi:laccase 12 [Actinidia rufa]|uniref:Laccase 12 n=1 Tax=Actinidia rufa TaxID=165716 RepID=A0A7J0FSN2_9ERIC|nr:laccase 12 [Actinidia rufa]
MQKLTTTNLFFQLPGPTLEVQNGDTLAVKVLNSACYNLPSTGTVRFSVSSGDRILLRIINAALDQQLFFAVANPTGSLIAADAAYNKPFTTSILMLGPGQTTDVLLTADQTPGGYYMAARACTTVQNAPFDDTTTAILEYKSTNKGVPTRPTLPRLPANKRHSYRNIIHNTIQKSLKGKSPNSIFSTEATLFIFMDTISMLLDKVLVTLILEEITAASNLIDPPQRNTIDVPVGGWAFIRFVADNPVYRVQNRSLADAPVTSILNSPGVWLCHSWSKNGVGELQSVVPPPADLPPC